MQHILSRAAKEHILSAEAGGRIPLMTDVNTAGLEAGSQQLTSQADILIVRRKPSSITVDWELGDLCNEITRFSRMAAERVRTIIRKRRIPDEELTCAAQLRWTEIPRIADEIGISRQHLMTIAQVAAIWPKGHWVRETNLPLSHLKRLAPIKDPSLREELIHLALQPAPPGVRRSSQRPMTLRELSELIRTRTGSVATEPD